MRRGVERRGVEEEGCGGEGMINEIIGASLHKPHTSEIALCACMCRLLTC